jgi:hypothetical protein
LQKNITTKTAKEKLFALVGREYGIVAQSILDLENTPCVRNFLLCEYENQQSKLSNLYGDFLLEDHDKMFKITRARFFELHNVVKELEQYSKFTYNFLEEAQQEVDTDEVETAEVETALANIRHELQELLYIVYDFNQIDRELEGEIVLMHNKIKLLQDSFDKNITNRALNRKHDIMCRFEEDLAYCLEYLDAIMLVVNAIYESEQKEKLGIKFDFISADPDMEELMNKIAQMVDQFNSNRK